MNPLSPVCLLDTDWTINYLTGNAEYKNRLETIGLSQLGVSIITVAELYEGAWHSANAARSLQQLKQFLLGVTVLNITDEICQMFGQERGRLRRIGMKIADFDLLIACTALYHDIPLHTNNRKHFERIDGLEIVSMPSRTSQTHL